MTQEDIRRKKEEIKAKQRKLKDELDVLAEELDKLMRECNHPNAIPGEWDNNRYCFDCGAVN